MRKSWDRHFMEKALHEAEMSTCAAGRKVGAVFVRDKRPLCSGFNGVPAGFPHPATCARREAGVPSGQGLDLCPCAHAERNAINNAAREGIRIRGATLYVTCMPCSMCAGDLVNAGVAEVVYLEPYPSEMTEAIVRYGQMALRQLTPDVVLRGGLDDRFGDHPGDPKLCNVCGSVALRSALTGRLVEVLKCVDCGGSVTLWSQGSDVDE